MYTLGIPKRDYRRATQVLGYESAEEVVFNATLQDDGFYIFTFPEVGDEYNFRKIANRLKSEGVRVVGADAQLTEKKIMKLASLINLESLQEIDFNDPALMRARAAKDQMSQIKPNPRIGFDQVLDLRDEKQDLERQISNLYREMESDPDIEAEGGEVADQYGDTLNRLEARLYKIDKQIASYDMSERTDAISTARALPKDDRDEEDERNDQNLAQDDTRFERMNEAKIKTKEEFDKIASAEQKAMEKKWDSLDTTIAFKKEDPKQHAANMEAKLEYLKDLNKAGKLKKDYSDDKLENWSIESSLFGWDIASTVLKTPKSTTEGSCGYGPNGVPGNTPGETKGMNADDRTRGMLKMLIQKEIAKYENK